jgi:ribosomal protein S18 acetylase RimI-like enzyme
MSEDNSSEAQKETLGPATTNDIDWIWRHVHQAIDELPFYNDDFKAFEKARMNKNFLHALINYNPHHIIVARVNGERAGFTMSGPDNGTLFLYWSYVLPEFRKSRVLMKGKKLLIDTFENSEFHKIATFTRPENRVAIIMLKRFGWTEAAHLKSHIFGQDYFVFEKPLNKVTEGYRPFIVKGRMGRLKDRLKSFLKR